MIMHESSATSPSIGALVDSTVTSDAGLLSGFPCRKYLQASEQCQKLLILCNIMKSNVSHDINL